jgi:hypothetical protein
VQPVDGGTLMIKIGATLGAIAVAIAAVMWAARGRHEPAVSDATPLPPALAASEAPYRGLAIQVASGWYRPREKYFPLLAEIAEMGANTVLFCTPGQMEHARSQSIYIDHRKVPPPEDLKALIRKARELGLKPILMPIVLLKNPRGSEWRGVIEPPDWDAWWEQYESFILYFTDIAREAGADALMVGSELVSAEKFTARWRALIDKCRRRFYGGKLGYSANWDHYRPVEFWDKLDFIGMTSYYTLADREGPTVEEIVDRWQPIKQDILAWQRRIRKPILLTEVGWCSQEGAAMAPWNYYQNQNATPAALEEQRRLYEAFIRVWDDTPALLGVIWWEWSDAPGGPGDYGYSPRGKPAEKVLRQWLSAGRRSATTAPVTAGGE